MSRNATPATGGASTGDMQAVIDAARASNDFREIATIGKNRHIMLPGLGDTPAGIETIDMEAGGAVPLRKRGLVVVFDAASFNQVIADNADAGNVAIYVDRNPDTPSVEAVLNGCGKSGPGWGDFRVKIEFRKTPQWLKWSGINGKMLKQVDFAEFIEDNLEDIAEPAGAQLLEIATYLQAARSVQFKSGIKLSSGEVQLQHLEDIQAQVGPGFIAVPETIVLGIAPIYGLPSYAVPARFRYRIAEGKLELGVKLQRVETLMAKIIEDVVAKIERGTMISMLDGKAPAAIAA